MSSFWSNVTGRGSGDKPPSGRSRSVSRSKDVEAPKGRPATRERPQDNSREDDDHEKQAARNDEEEGDGCLNMSRLKEQMLGRGGGRGVLRVGLLPAFTRAGRTGSLPHPKRQPSNEPASLSTPTPPPTPTNDHQPPVPDSPKPKVKGVGRKRAASASPTRDKRRSFRGISRDRLPAFPHLPHLPSLPPQLRNILHRGGGGERDGHSAEVPSPNKPTRRPGPVGRTWVKVYDDITFMDEQEEEMYPMLGYTGHPAVVPEASPLPTPPTPPPPRTGQRHSSTASEYDNVPKEERSTPELIPEPEVLGRRSPSPEPPAQADEPQPPTAHTESQNSVGQGRGRDRFRGRRQKRTGTPVRVGREEDKEPQDEDIDAAALAALEAEIIVAPKEEEDYIIPQALQPPRPPRGHKTYDHVEDLSKTDSPPQQEVCEEPRKPRRGVKVYDELIFRRQHQLGIDANTLPSSQFETMTQEEAVLEQEIVPQQSVTEQEAAPQQEAAMQEETTTQEETVTQETVTQQGDVTQEEVPTLQEAVSQESDAAPETAETQEQVNASKETEVTEAPRREGEPPRPRRGLKVYDTVEMRRRAPTQDALQTDTEEPVLEVICRDESKAGSKATAEEPQRPSRGHKIYASLIIQPHTDRGEAQVAEVTLNNGGPFSATHEADTGEPSVLPEGEAKADSKEAETTGGEQQEQQEQRQQQEEEEQQVQQQQQKEEQVQQQQQQQQEEQVQQQQQQQQQEQQVQLQQEEEQQVQQQQQQQQVQQQQQQQEVQMQQQQQPVEGTVPPYARVLKGSGTRELRPMVPSDDDEPPPPIPPKKKGLRAITPQLDAVLPPRPPRHLKPRITTSILMVNGDVLPARPARGTKIYESVKPTTPTVPKRYSKVVRIEDLDDVSAHPPPKPSRHALHPPRRRRKKQEVQKELDGDEQQPVTARLTFDTGKVTQVTTLTTDQQDNYENITMSGGCPQPATRNRNRPLPPPPPPPKKGRIQQRYKQQQQQQQQQQQSGESHVNENGVTAAISGGEVGSPEGAGPTLGEHHPPSRPAAPGRVASKRRGAARLQNDINENLKTIESSFATLDTVLKSLQTYSRSSPPRTVVKGSSEQPCENTAPAPTSTQPAATQAVITASPTVSKSDEAATPTDVSTNHVTGAASQQVTLDSTKTDQVQNVESRTVNKETGVAQSCQSDAVNNRLILQPGVCHESVESKSVKVDDLPQETDRFKELKSESSDQGVSESSERGLVDPQRISVSVDSDAKDVTNEVKDSKVTGEESVKDPEKVQTVPQTSVKFQEGKTLFETAVKIGDNQGTEEQLAGKTDVQTQETLLPVKKGAQKPEISHLPTHQELDSAQHSETPQKPTQPESHQHPAQQLESPQQPDRSVQDPEKVVTVPQTSLKFEEGKTLFETTVKVGDNQPESPQQLSEKPESTQQSAEQPERSPLPSKGTKDSIKDPEKVQTVPQTSLKFQEGKTLFETAVKIGDDQGSAEHSASKSDVQTPETLSPVDDTQEAGSCQQPDNTKEQPQHQAESPKQPDPIAKDPEKVPVAPETSFKFQEGKTVSETSVKVGEEQPTQQLGSLQFSPQLTENIPQEEEKSQSREEPSKDKDSIKDPEKVQTVPQTSLKFQEGKTIFETAVKIGEGQGTAEHSALKSDVQTPETLLAVKADAHKPEGEQQPTLQKPEIFQQLDHSVKDPEKVPTVPQTSLKFEEGKTLFETSVKVGDDLSTQPSERPQQHPEGTKELQQLPQQPESTQQPAEQLETAQQPDRSTKDPEKVVTVPQTSLKFEEGKTLFETTVKVGDNQPESPQHPSEKPESIQQSAEQPESPAWSSKDTKDSIKDPEKVQTVPQTSLKFQEGKTLFETAVKIGNDQGSAEHSVSKSDVQTPETLSPVDDTQEAGSQQFAQHQTESPKQPKSAVKDPEKVSVVPQTSLKFEEGKTLFETAVKIGEDEDGAQQAKVSSEEVQETEAAESQSGASAQTKGKTVFETLFRVESIKRSKPTEAVTEGEAASDHRKEQGSAEISDGGAAGEAEQLERAGGEEQPPIKELQEGVADLASRLQGIRSTLESAICNFPPALTPVPVPASASPTPNTAEAAAPPAEERPPSPAHTHHLPCCSKVDVCFDVCLRMSVFAMCVAA
ncbi:titin-like isoform X1 [Scylla paramamosain]|uniref:titin-like isoform X1 n=1 Tax=Scylla paramamosain TaxID=85552 RepID=UPI0030838DE3